MKKLAGKLILPRSELQKEFLDLMDLEKTNCHPEINVIHIQETTITRCGISPSEVTAQLLISQAIGSREEENAMVIHG